MWSKTIVTLVLFAGVVTVWLVTAGHGERKKLVSVRGRVLFEGRPVAHALIDFAPFGWTGSVSMSESPINSNVPEYSPTGLPAVWTSFIVCGTGFS